MNRILALSLKELIAVWRDKKSRFILIVPPLLQLFVFAFAATLDVENVTLGVLNRDAGEQGFYLIERFRGSPTFSHVICLGAVEEIAPFMDMQKGAIVLSIDAEFSRRLDAGEKTAVQVILDGRKSNTAQVVAGYVGTIVNRFARDFAKEKSLFLEPIVLVSRNWFNPNLLYYWFTVPGLLALLTMLEAILITALSVARERELGTFDQLLVSPLSPQEILLGKTIPSIFIAMVEGTVILFTLGVIFQIPVHGSIPLLYLAMFCFVTGTTGIGLLISSFCATQQQAILGAFLFITPAILLSGFATPIENMPDWLQVATYLNPVRYFLYIARGVCLRGIPPSVILQHTWPLALMAVCILTLASRCFRRRLF